MKWVLLGAVVALLIAGVGSAVAEDLSTNLANAEQRVTELGEEVSSQQQQVDAAEARYRAAADRAAPAVQDLNEKRAKAQRLRADLVAREKGAAARINQLKDRHQQEVDDHDREVREGVGFGLAALVAALIAIAWGRFRATSVVAALTRIEPGQAIGVCIGGGLLLVIVGVALGSSNGALGALGAFLFWLGLILPTALLLARHSAEVQRGRSKPLLRRKRLPGWVSPAIAGLMLVVFLASTGSALFADDASSQPISAQLREEADAASEGQGAEELEATRIAIGRAQQQAAGPLGLRNEAQAALAAARRGLRGARSRLADAQSSERSFSRRLVALEAKEQREAEREEARAAREAEEQAEIEAEEQAAECNPNYSGCLDPYSPDYDCAGGSGDGPDYTGIVEVIGYDEYGLDADGDGIGCE